MYKIYEYLFKRTQWSVQNKNVMIIGGSSGLGLSFATLCAKKGAKTIVLVARNKGKLETAQLFVRNSCTNPNTKITIHPNVDITSSTATTGLCLDEYNTDAVVCCAGFARCQLLTSLPRSEGGEGNEDYWESMLHTNLLGNMRVARQTVQYFKRTNKHHGRLVLVGSTLSVMGLSGYAGYCASKWGLRGFFECLKQEMNVGRAAILYAPTMKTPGLVEENKTKPDITKKLEGGGGVSAWDVANTLYNGMKMNKNEITCDVMTEAMLRSDRLPFLFFILNIPYRVIRFVVNRWIGYMNKKLLP